MQNQKWENVVNFFALVTFYSKLHLIIATGSHLANLRSCSNNLLLNNTLTNGGITMEQWLSNWAWNLFNYTTYIYVYMYVYTMPNQLSKVG